MAAVDQPVTEAAAPAQHDVVLDPERAAHASERRDRDALHRTALQYRHRLLVDPGDPRHVDLAQAEMPANGRQQPPDLRVVHAPIVASAASPAIHGRFAKAYPSRGSSRS